MGLYQQNMVIHLVNCTEKQCTSSLAKYVEIQGRRLLGISVAFANKVCVL